MTVYDGTSAGAIQQHYDLGNAFYRLWLDPSMTYSAAVWEGTDDLAQAQVAKLEHHIQASGAHGAARVLDVGCGWGSTLRRLVEDHQVGHAMGLTLSEDQHQQVRSMGLPGVDVRLESWSDHVVDEPYDAAISIGAFEHFARVDHTPEQKARAYARFFDKMHSLLRPGARLSLQSIVFGTLDELDPFIQQQIWPESNLPHLHELVAATRKRFEVEVLTNDRMDYARTCRAWSANLAAQRANAEALVGPEGYANYQRYLKMSARAFEVGAMGLIRVRLRRLD